VVCFHSTEIPELVYLGPDRVLVFYGWPHRGRDSRRSICPKRRSCAPRWGPKAQTGRAGMDGGRPPHPVPLWPPPSASPLKRPGARKRGLLIAIAGFFFPRPFWAASGEHWLRVRLSYYGPSLQMAGRAARRLPLCRRSARTIVVLSGGVSIIFGGSRPSPWST